QDGRELSSPGLREARRLGPRRARCRNRSLKRHRPLYEHRAEAVSLCPREPVRRNFGSRVKTLEHMARASGTATAMVAIAIAAPESLRAAPRRPHAAAA